MWNWLYRQTKLYDLSKLPYHTNKVSGRYLFAFTGGYKLELRGRALGTYFIAGGDGTTEPPASKASFQMVQASVAFLLGLLGI